METFLGEIILESLVPSTDLSPYRKHLVKERVVEIPKESVPLWHIQRYRLPRSKVLEITAMLSHSLASGEWYVHFFGEQGNELYVVLSSRVFLLPKRKDSSWEAMMQYGESVGIGRRWTESIPVELPD
jgi:hypothetical protein